MIAQIRALASFRLPLQTPLTLAFILQYLIAEGFPLGHASPLMPNNIFLATHLFSLDYMWPAQCSHFILTIIVIHGSLYLINVTLHYIIFTNMHCKWQVPMFFLWFLFQIYLRKVLISYWKSSFHIYSIKSRVTIITACSYTFTLFWLSKTFVIVKTYQLCFCVFICTFHLFIISIYIFV